jgi:putative transposase
MRYRRARVPGASYFFTVVAWHRRQVLCRPEVRAALRTAFREELRARPFELEAIVVLPDHLHCIWTLPPGDSDFSGRWRRIKASVSRAVGQEIEAEPTPSRRLKGERGLWQRRYWEHVIRDEADFAAHLDYIHFNPVKHGLVERAADWPWSSLHRYMAEGAYPLGWGEADICFRDGIGRE